MAGYRPRTGAFHAGRPIFRDQAEIDGMAADVRAAGARFELFEYGGAGHLFTDPSLPAEYDGAATETLWSRVLALLGGLGG